MRSEEGIHARSSRRSPSPLQPSDEDMYASSAEEQMHREANDRRLRQAITYLAVEGGPDSPNKFINRVQRIDRLILQEYEESGCAFDTGLHEQLRSMLQEAQRDSQRAPEEASSESPVQRNSSYDNTLSLEALLRESDDVEPPRPADSFSPYADVRQIQFRYGGPNNEVEEWHRNLPPSLPFGETLYMQELESLRINYDLRESAKRKPGDAPIAYTNVGFEAVGKAGFRYKDNYDSGSRFKLPNISDEIRKLWSFRNPSVKLQKVIDEFNQGGSDEQERRNKDYAPRIFLEKIVVRTNERDSHSRPRPEVTFATLQSVASNSTVRTSRGSKRDAGSSKYGTISSSALSQLRKHLQRETAETSSDSEVLDDSRAGLIQTPTVRETTSALKSTKSSAISREVGEPRHVTFVTPSFQNRKATSARHPGTRGLVGRRPVHVDTPESSFVASRPSFRSNGSASSITATKWPTSSATPGKRKVTEVKSFEAVKKPCVLGRQSEGKLPKKVSYADNEGISVRAPDLSPRDSLQQKVVQAGKTQKGEGQAGKKKTGMSAMSLSTAQGHENVKRGTTRSGIKFK